MKDSIMIAKEKLAQSEFDSFDIDNIIEKIVMKRRASNVQSSVEQKDQVIGSKNNSTQSSQISTQDSTVTDTVSGNVKESKGVPEGTTQNDSSKGADNGTANINVISEDDIKEIIKGALVRGVKINSISDHLIQRGLDKDRCNNIIHDSFSSIDRNQIIAEQQIEDKKKANEGDNNMSQNEDNQNQPDEKVSKESDAEQKNVEEAKEQTDEPSKDKQGKDAEDYDRSRDAFKPGELAELEKAEAEKNKSLMDKLFAKKENTEKNDDNGKEVVIERDVFDGSYLDRATKAEIREITNRIMEEYKKRTDDIQLMVEKVDGKIAREKEVDEGLNMRISDLVEKIGELRSTIMGRERFFDKMENDFESMKDVIHDLKPERIKKEFEDKEKSILQLDAKIEKATNVLETMSVDLKKYKEIMTKIVSYENLLATLEDLNKKVKKIDETERYMEKIGGRLETSYSDLNKKLGTIVTHDEKLRGFEEMTKEFTKNIDLLQNKLEKKLNKNDIEKVYPEFEKKFNEHFGKINDEIAVLKDALFRKEVNESNSSSIVYPNQTTDQTISNSGVSSPGNQKVSDSSSATLNAPENSVHVEKAPSQNQKSVSPQTQNLSRESSTPSSAPKNENKMSIKEKELVNALIKHIEAKIDSDQAPQYYKKAVDMITKYPEDPSINQLKNKLTEIRSKMLGSDGPEIKFSWGNWNK
ncbi:hypothetical protein K9M79_00090 [Candidatus Woesearchaeota archaeon]|nr:hypothetical protein [Candidatus Woesearchaeota archaeon]